MSRLLFPLTTVAVLGDAGAYMGPRIKAFRTRKLPFPDAAEEESER